VLEAGPTAALLAALAVFVFLGALTLRSHTQLVLVAEAGTRDAEARVARILAYGDRLSAFGLAASILGAVLVALAGLGINRNQAAARARHAELEELAHAVDLAPVMLRDPDGRIRHWSSGLERFYGWGADEAVGGSSHELLATEFPQPLAQIEAILLQEGAWQGELRHRRRDGSSIAVTSHWALHRDGRGRPATVIEVNSDVTALKAAEAALKESEARFRNVADHAPVITWMTDEADRCAFLSRPWREVTGQSEVEGRGKGWLACIHPDDAPVVEAAFLAASAARRPFRLDFRLRRRDGSHGWVANAGVPRFAADGAFRGYVGSISDIDERKELERRQELLVRELNHRVKNILAVTQAVARLSGAGATSLDAFLHAFNGRLQALAAANELLTGSGWVSTGLDALLVKVLQPHGAQDQTRFVLKVRDGQVPASLAQDLTLALHELATNAAKYGALSTPDGRVVVEAEAGGPDTDAALRLVWREEGGPTVVAPARPGFGTRLLRQLVTGQHGGTLDVDWHPEGLVCRLELPAQA
jgi:PAS domain S-box-containing protein